MTAHKDNTEAIRSTPSVLSPAEMRREIREGRWRRPTAGCCAGFTQVNLVILPQALADDFRLFCKRNPKPCPLLEEVPVGQIHPQRMAPSADLRTDCPRYQVWRWNTRTHCDDIREFWRDDLVSFLLGCSFTFEQALQEAGLPVRHLEQGCNVPMYTTNQDCVPTDEFQGPLVVSMRPMTPAQAAEAATITARFPAVHGAPIQIGDPDALGIRDLGQPDYGDPVEIRPGEIPVFWACGVTPQIALSHRLPKFAITHAPGYMLITDIKDRELAEYSKR